MSNGVASSATTRPTAPSSAPPSASHSAYAVAALQAAQWAAASYASQPPSGPPAALAPAPAGDKAHEAAVHVPVAGSTAPRAAVRAKSNWPLNFETNGASYVFQTQSGVFYDASQRYYYCPKSKLYYNEVTGVYLCTAPPGSDHPYQEFEPPEPTHKPTEEAASSVGQLSESGGVGAAGASKARKPVVLSMNLGKSKSKAATKDTSGSAGSEGSSTVINKKVSDNIAKWGERQGELLPESDEGSRDTKSPAASVCSDGGSAQSFAATVDPSSIPAGTTPAPATSFASGTKCLLCRRQFTSVEQLQRHERESQLHAENVAKAAKAKSSAPLAGSGQAYRDRASERRGLYGQSATPEDAAWSGGRKRGADVLDRAPGPPPGPVASETGPVAVADDVANPGNQLLRRMGWNDGKGLGKDESGRVESIAVSAGSSARPPQSKVGVGNTEAAAIPSLEYGDTVTYKNSVIKATRARFDQVSGSNDGRK
jgi:hypothetical protein